MSADNYLHTILAREAVDTSPSSPVLSVRSVLLPVLSEWAGSQLAAVTPSGSFAKGTANKSGTDIDLFVSLASSTQQTLKQLYEGLFTKMREKGYNPSRQNVSINVRVNGYDVDLVPARRHDAYSQDYSLYRRRADTWTKTNVDTHISHVIGAACAPETRVLKLWRNQKKLDVPSFYLELTVIAALRGKRKTSLADNVLTCFEYLRDSFSTARVVDTANTNNVLSDELTTSEKSAVSTAAQRALLTRSWNEVVQ